VSADESRDGPGEESPSVAGSEWPPAPTRCAPAPHEVHVYRFALDVPASVLSTLKGWLTPDELARAGRFRFARDAARYSAGRAALRSIVGGFIAQPPERVPLVYGANGKPALADDARVRFNLSRSSALGLLAVQLGDDLGVDVEEVRPFPDGLDIARWLFATEDFHALDATTEPQRTTAFFRLWTRKEAVIKSLGLALSRPLNDFPVVPVDLNAPRTVSIATPARSVTCTLLPVPDPQPGYVAALATAGAIRALRCWTWQPEP
jgi:4'-phosphopantetheinyl transferase